MRLGEGWEIEGMGREMRKRIGKESGGVAQRRCLNGSIISVQVPIPDANVSGQGILNQPTSLHHLWFVETSPTRGGRTRSRDTYNSLTFQDQKV